MLRIETLPALLPMRGGISREEMGIALTHSDLFAMYDVMLFALFLISFILTFIMCEL